MSLPEVAMKLRISGVEILTVTVVFLSWICSVKPIERVLS